MTTFKVGDRVRLFSLDGKLFDQVHELHDLWGDEDSPSNASFISGNQEQFYHTDLMKLEADDTPVVVPDGGVWFIARGSNHGWGRAKTVEAAIANMRRAGGSSNKSTAYVVDRVSKWTRVNDMGGLNYPLGIEPVEVKRVEPKRKAKARA
jgi:hypothetical protein